MEPCGEKHDHVAIDTKHPERDSFGREIFPAVCKVCGEHFYVKKAKGQSGEFGVPDAEREDGSVRRGWGKK